MTVKSTSAISLVFAGLLATRPALAQEATTDRPVVTIAPFETGRTGWVPPSGFGQIMAERLGQRLVESGHYRVLDSELLTREPSGARPGVVPLQAWRDRAERAGVSYLLIGSVTQYSKEERRRSGGGATAVLQLIIGARLHVPIAAPAGRRKPSRSSASRCA
jgi:hypothetical protein